MGGKVRACLLQAGKSELTGKGLEDSGEKFTFGLIDNGTFEMWSGLCHCYSQCLVTSLGQNSTEIKS